MRISVRFKDEAAIVSLTGKFLAGSDGPFLRQKVKDLIDAGATMMVLDFARVPTIDSTGLGFLAGSRVTAEKAGVRMALASVNPHVKKILDQVRLTQFFVLAEDEAAALATVKRGIPPVPGAEPALPKTQGEMGDRRLPPRDRLPGARCPRFPDNKGSQF